MYIDFIISVKIIYRYAIFSVKDVFTLSFISIPTFVAN